jgi:hypothetical protein
MCACPGSVHERTVSSSSTRNRFEATTDIGATTQVRPVDLSCDCCAPDWPFRSKGRESSPSKYGPPRGGLRQATLFLRTSRLSAKPLRTTATSLRASWWRRVTIPAATNFDTLLSNSARSFDAPGNANGTECESPLGGHRISRFHESLCLADVRELARSTSRYRDAEGHRAGVHCLEPVIYVATAKHTSIVPRETEGAISGLRRHVGWRARRCPTGGS